MNWTTTLVLLAFMATVHTAAADGKDQLPAADHAWQALLDDKTLSGWKVADFREEGKITVSNGELHISPGEPAAGIVRDGKPPPRLNDEIELEAQRTFPEAGLVPIMRHDVSRCVLGADHWPPPGGVRPSPKYFSLR